MQVSLSTARPQQTSLCQRMLRETETFLTRHLRPASVALGVRRPATSFARPLALQ